MKGFDIEFITYFNRIRGLDWTGLDLWVFGGIVSGWDTKDIDTVIIGETIPEGMLKQIQELGPWDICYTNEMVKPWFPGDRPVKIKVLTPQARWIYYKIPTNKHKLRLKHGIRYGKPFQLIKKGIIQL